MLRPGRAPLPLVAAVALTALVAALRARPTHAAEATAASAPPPAAPPLTILADQPEASTGWRHVHSRFPLPRPGGLAGLAAAAGLLGERSFEAHTVLLPRGGYRARLIDQPLASQLTAPPVSVLTRRARARLGINGGYFDPRFEPVGLYVLAGVQRRPFREATLLSATVVIGTSGQLDVRTRRDPYDDARYALQCGPLILDPGGELGIRPGPGPEARRTVLAVADSGALAVIATTAVSLRALAEALHDHPEGFGAPRFERALNLDGGPSTAMTALFTDPPLQIEALAPVRTAIVFSLPPRRRPTRNVGSPPRRHALNPAPPGAARRRQSIDTPQAAPAGAPARARRLHLRYDGRRSSMSNANPAAPRTPRKSQSMSVLPAVEAQPNASRLQPRNVARYQRVRSLGEGGNGEVDLWHDQDIDRDVAVKRLKQTGTPELMAQFIQEVQTTGKLEHPGIVPLYDVGLDEEGRYFFVMKHVQGETLEQIISRLRVGDPAYVQRYSYEVRTQIFLQILHSVQYAHRKGYVHCDIKPANIIVGTYGEVMVLDWGLAQRKGDANASMTGPTPAASRTPRPLRVSGTPDYMSPEQAMGEEGVIDERTDTYCLCVLFYELITLHYYLGPASTVIGRLTSILTEEPMSALMMHHRYQAPPELTNFIRPGLAKAPAQRYQSVDEMIDKLQAVINGNIPIVCPCTGAKRFAHYYGDFLNDHPIAGIVILCLLGIFTVFGVLEAVRQTIQFLT
jgi:serine/threonine-protein kinase